MPEAPEGSERDAVRDGAYPELKHADKRYTPFDAEHPVVHHEWIHHYEIQSVEGGDWIPFAKSQVRVVLRHEGESVDLSDGVGSGGSYVRDWAEDVLRNMRPDDTIRTGMLDEQKPLSRSHLPDFPDYPHGISGEFEGTRTWRREELIELIDERVKKVDKDEWAWTVQAINDLVDQRIGESRPPTPASTAPFWDGVKWGDVSVAPQMLSNWFLSWSSGVLGAEWTREDEISIRQWFNSIERDEQPGIETYQSVMERIDRERGTD